jgi:hypothetical protein
MRRTRFAALGIACASILLAGCRMNVITEIGSSGGGTLTTEIGMTPDEVAQLQSLGGESGDSVCSAFSSDQLGAADAPAFEEKQRGEETWCVAAVPFADVDELAALYQEMGSVRIRELTLREGLLVYDLEIDAQGSDQAMALVETTWVLVLPGKLGTHNADRVDGNRLTWTLESGSVSGVQASSDLLAPSLPFGLDGSEGRIIAAVACACCGGVFLLLVLLVIVLLFRRKRSEAASGGGPSPPSSGD